MPLAHCVAGANRHDSMAFEVLDDALPTIAGQPGRPQRCMPTRPYDTNHCRDHLRQRGITPRIARKAVERNDRLGRHRWVVERTHAWFAGMGKLRIRFERSIDTHLALLSLACSVICIKSLV